MVPFLRYRQSFTQYLDVNSHEKLQNPLHFSFPPEVDEEGLMQAAEQLSQTVLESGLVISP